MKRRAKGEGSVYFDKEAKRWIGQAAAPPDPLTGKRRRIKVVGAVGERKGDVAARLRGRIDELSNGTTPGTVAELVETWITRAAPKKKSVSTLATARTLVDKHILPAFGKVRAADLRAEDVERWMDAMAAAGLAKATIVKTRSQLSQAYDFGLRRRTVSFNPAKIAEAPNGMTAAREGRALTGPEARALLNVADHDRYGAWATVALATGLRPGEVSGLTWTAVALDEARIVVHQSLAWQNGRPELKEPKTGRTRTIDIPPRVVGALRRHRTNQVQERLLMGDRWPIRWQDLVFVTSNGRPIGASYLRRIISKMAAEAGIEGDVSPYTLRHTAASLLSAAGVAPELLADLLGHRDLRMLFRHYRHPVYANHFDGGRPHRASVSPLISRVPIRVPMWCGTAIG